MEVSFRPLRIFNRLFRRMYYGVSSYKTSAVPEKAINTGLLNAYNQDIKAGGVVPVFRRALLFPTRVALQDDFGIYTYAGLHQAAAELSTEIAAELLGDTEQTIAYMCGNEASHIIVQWAIWMSGNIAVPLTPLHPPEMLKYFLTDSDAKLVISSQQYENTLIPIAKELSKPLIVTSRDKEITAQMYEPNSGFMKPKQEGLTDVGKSNSWYGDSEALIIYTSGTTSKPKGVIWTHSMLDTQISALHTAWQYSCNDVVLHTLPLHHIHGQLNSMLASLAAGARLRMLPQFASHTVWARLLGMGERDETKVTVFHGVPAMYARLAADHETLFGDARAVHYVKSTLSQRMRLMCAGSAPLPATLFAKWEQISGMRLLERYGMSECGMALSNPYHPVESRTVSCVGLPLPGMSARIAAVDESGELQPLVTVETPLADPLISLDRLGLTSKDYFSEVGSEWQEPKVTYHKKKEDGVYEGELLLQGPGVFSRYLNRPPKLDNSEFTSDEWFRTGDTASYTDNKFKILGRTSIDIIKTGGYKVSALQIESAILEHTAVADAAVLGIEDEGLGEIVTAVVVLKDKAKLTHEELREAMGKKLAKYQVPRTFLTVDVMPRNAMGKLDKKEIRRLYGNELKK